jgi:hypothetical protein
MIPDGRELFCIISLVHAYKACRAEVASLIIPFTRKKGVQKGEDDGGGVFLWSTSRVSRGYDDEILPASSIGADVPDRARGRSDSAEEHTNQTLLGLGEKMVGEGESWRAGGGTDDRCSGDRRWETVLGPASGRIWPSTNDGWQDQDTPRVRSTAGVIGRSPYGETRGEILTEVEDDRSNGGGDGNRGDFPPLSQQGEASSSQNPIPQSQSRIRDSSSPLSQHNKIQSQIDKFVGYFRKQSGVPTSARSYAQVVRSESPWVKMVNP